MSVTSSPYASLPKIELHTHLEGTIRAATLLSLAKRNGQALPADSVEGLAELYRFEDFPHFLEVWQLTTNCLRTAQDFAQVVVDYAAEAASCGAVYLEGIFSPAERVATGVSWDAVFNGYCDGAQQAEEDHGVTVRLTPDIHWGIDPAEASEVARRAVAMREWGAVGLGVGGAEGAVPPRTYAKAFAIARDGGLGSVPHAGEAAGPECVRAVVEVLGAHRVRHGIRAVEDPALLAELARRGTVLDVCPTSNLRTRVVKRIEDHPLPSLMAAGVRCSVSTDDPAMFGTNLAHEYELAADLGVSLREVYGAAVSGALCDEDTRARLSHIEEQASWDPVVRWPAGDSVGIGDDGSFSRAALLDPEVRF
ncbi:MAG: adenosine deaminase [Acidimicrobiales bacterium]